MAVQSSECSGSASDWKRNIEGLRHVFSKESLIDQHRYIRRIKGYLCSGFMLNAEVVYDTGRYVLIQLE